MKSLIVFCAVILAVSAQSCRGSSKRICESNPCHNGGVCKSSPGSWKYECICPDSFTGYDCRTSKVDLCQGNNNYCFNGGNLKKNFFLTNLFIFSIN